jgi:hypothetical protein
MRLEMSLCLVSSDCWKDCHPIALLRLFARGDAIIHVYSIAIAKILRWWIATQGKPEPSTGTEERSSVASLCGRRPSFNQAFIRSISRVFHILRCHMLSLSRRKPAQQQAVAPDSLAELPDDVLILICPQCRIDELFQLRLTSAKIRGLIDEYMTTIAPSVARSTFPLSEHLLSIHANSVTPPTLQSLKALIPEQLAYILVDRHRIADEWLQLRYGIPAEDAFGDELRNRVANGWCIFRDLSNCARRQDGEVTKETRSSRAEFANRVFRPTQFKFEALKHTEDMLLRRRLEYVRKLDPKHAQDYKLMFTLLSAAFSTSISNIGDKHEPWPFDFGGGIDGQRELRKGETWLSWYILGEGPDLFWQQWWSLPHDDPSTPNYIRDRAIAAFRNTLAGLANHQRNLAHTLQNAINEQTVLEGSFSASEVIQYFSRYAKHRLRRRDAGLPPANEILGHVSFLVNFRCPEEVAKRHAAVMEERNLGRTSQPQPR